MPEVKGEDLLIGNLVSTHIADKSYRNAFLRRCSRHLILLLHSYDKEKSWGLNA
jgi:hypothetical protein